MLRILLRSWMMGMVMFTSAYAYAAELGSCPLTNKEVDEMEQAAREAKSRKKETSNKTIASTSTSTSNKTSTLLTITDALYEKNVLPWGKGTEFFIDIKGDYWVQPKNFPAMLANRDGEPMMPRDREVWREVISKANQSKNNNTLPLCPACNHPAYKQLDYGIYECKHCVGIFDYKIRPMVDTKLSDAEPRREKEQYDFYNPPPSMFVEGTPDEQGQYRWRVMAMYSSTSCSILELWIVAKTQDAALKRAKELYAVPGRVIPAHGAYISTVVEIKVERDGYWAVVGKRELTGEAYQKQAKSYPLTEDDLARLSKPGWILDYRDKADIKDSDDRTKEPGYVWIDRLWSSRQWSEFLKKREAEKQNPSVLNEMVGGIANYDKARAQYETQCKKEGMDSKQPTLPLADQLGGGNIHRMIEMLGKPDIWYHQGKRLDAVYTYSTPGEIKDLEANHGAIFLTREKVDAWKAAYDLQEKREQKKQEKQEKLKK